VSKFEKLQSIKSNDAKKKTFESDNERIDLEKDESKKTQKDEINFY
jgi:hypothetical protein